MTNPVLTEETLRQLEELLQEKLGGMDRIMRVPATREEMDSLRNKSAIIDTRLKNALFDSAPELLRLAKIGISAEIVMKGLAEHTKLDKDLKP